ncbi:probable G-protein coupled receptor 63 [Haliotis rubra]|uniref:probable G-protein coupled receptor 63 n=1 Tax=Haliotis rubra TaxID=36100 RepID=UPI001EE58527|nr:probable G-protein coupled receptor 63 [Haliotis rubra]
MDVTNLSDVINVTTSCPVPSLHLHLASVPAPARRVLASFLLLTMTIAFGGNFVVCWIVYRKPAMRSAINLLLAHLGLTDICLSSVSIPVAVTGLLSGRWILGHTECVMTGFFHSLLNTVGIYTLLAISVDRYLIIVSRTEKLTVTRAKIIILLSWAVAGILTFPPVVGWGEYRPEVQILCSVGRSRGVGDAVYVMLATVLTTFVPLLLMFHSFLCIMVTMRKKCSRVQDQPHGVCISYNRKVVTATLGTVRRLKIDVGFKTRSFKTILLLFVVLTICWAPYSTWMMLNSLVQEDSSNWGPLLSCVCSLKAAINPIIYFARIKKFREACLSFVPRFCWQVSCVPTSLRRKVKPSTVYETREHPSSQCTRS